MATATKRVSKEGYDERETTHGTSWALQNEKANECVNQTSESIGGGLEGANGGASRLQSLPLPLWGHLCPLQQLFRIRELKDKTTVTLNRLTSICGGRAGRGNKRNL